MRAMRNTLMVAAMAVLMATTLTAAALCKKHNCSLRDVYVKHLDELKALMTRGVGDGKPHPLSALDGEAGILVYYAPSGT